MTIPVESCSPLSICQHGVSRVFFRAKKILDPNFLSTSLFAKKEKNPFLNTSDRLGQRQHTVYNMSNQSNEDPNELLDNSLQRVSALDEYDSDEEPQKETPKEWQNWRLDPVETLSDWTIEITTIINNEEKEQIDTYHVHKYALAVGPRNSLYFERLFGLGVCKFSEGQSSQSSINLHELAAEAFPVMLDFMYAPTGQLEATTENATALHYLGQYFEIRRLRWDAKQFWKKNLGLDTVAIYSEHARIFQDEKILNAVASVCAKKIMKIDASHRILACSDFRLWYDILHNNGMLPNDEFSRHLSTLIASFMEQNDVDADTFEQLTSADVLPEINFDAAQKLMELENKITHTSSDKMSGLEERCISALSQRWEGIRVEEEETLHFLRRQKPALLVKLLQETLLNAKAALEFEQTAHERARAKLIEVREELSAHYELDITRYA
jgi:hypothetical protein